MAERLELDLDHLRRLYDAGKSVLHISHALNASRPAIVRRLRELGLPIRSGTESQLLRNAALTPAQRRQFAAAAHDAVRGRKQTMEHRCKIAFTREAKARGIEPESSYERDMLHWLTGAGLSVTPQLAVGPYNVDLALTESRIAVEIFGGNWHATGRHAARFRKRTKFLLGCGWLPVYIWVSRGWNRKVFWSKASADYVVSLHQITRAGKAAGGKEHVIRGDGYITPVCTTNPHNGALILNVRRGNERRDEYGRFA